MLFETYGNVSSPAILFFHAMGVTGASSAPVAKCLAERYFCILPTSTVYCEGQKYLGKEDEVRQIGNFLREKGVKRFSCRVLDRRGSRAGVSDRIRNTGGSRLLRRRAVRADLSCGEKDDDAFPVPRDKEPLPVKRRDSEKNNVV